MEQNKNQDSRQLQTLDSVPAKSHYETPANKNFIEALKSKKLFDCSTEELIEAISIAVSTAYADLSRKIDNSLNDELEYMVTKLPGSLKRLFPSMGINEIGLAIERGTFKEFGEYYGINVAEIVRFCRTHLESIDRINAAKIILKPVDNQKLPPSLSDQFETFRNNLLNAFEKNKVGGNYESNGPGLYDFCNKLKLVVFSTKEKYDIMQDAAQAIVKDQHNILFVTVADFERKPYQKIINIITDHINEDKPLTEGIKTMLIAKSKFLTLKAFFNEIELSYLDLATVIDSKKDLFVNE